MKIFEALRRDHDKQRALIKLVLDSSCEFAMAKQYFEQLKHQLESHALAEERYFYAPLMHKEQTENMSQHGLDEHEQIDKLMTQLENTQMNSSKWLVTFEQLANKVEQHLIEEEHVYFQKAGEVISEKDKENLATLYNSQMETC